jgi:hypothetical protein
MNSNGTDTTAISSLQVFALEEFMGYIPEPQDWYIDNLIPAGSVTLFAGREKSGKTSILIDLVCAVATGEPFLGRETQQVNTLLIPLEDHIREIQSRVMTRLDGARPQQFHYYPPTYLGYNDQDLRLEDNVLMDRFKATIVERKIKLIALDPLRELHDMAENDADEMAPTLRVLRDMAHELNVAIVVSHHASRGGGYRGSTAIGGAVDQIISFKRKDQEGDDAWVEGTPRGVMRVEGRYGQRQVMTISMGENFCWEVGDGIAEPQKSSNLRAHIIDLLRDELGHGREDGLIAEEIANRLGKTKKTVQNEISTILRETDPVIAAHPSEGAAKPRRYFALDPYHIYFGDGLAYA